MKLLTVLVLVLLLGAIAYTAYVGVRQLLRERRARREAQWRVSAIPDLGMDEPEDTR